MYSLLMFVFTGLAGYPSDDINKFLWMVRIGGGVFPHIKELDYLVSDYHYFTQKKKKNGLGFYFIFFGQRNWMIL
jgi:hypothetical protein